MFEQMIVSGYDYSIEIRDDMNTIRNECKTISEDPVMLSYIEGIEYVGMLGSRIVIGVPFKLLNDKTIAMNLVKTIGKSVYEKYGFTYGIELIPRDKTEFIMHILRKGHDIEHTVITETKHDLSSDNKGPCEEKAVIPNDHDDELVISFAEPYGEVEVSKSNLGLFENVMRTTYKELDEYLR